MRSPAADGAVSLECSVARVTYPPMEVWGHRLCNNSLVIPSYRGSVPCLLGEHWLKSPVSFLCTSLPFAISSCLQWGIMLWDELLMHCWAVPSLWAALFLSIATDLIAAGFSPHRCAGETPFDSWWQVRTAQLCL